VPELTRRQVLAAAGAVAAGAHAAPSTAPSDAPPNLLFLMTDQHHHQALGCMGNPVVETPHLDKLAAEGVRFTHAFCPVPYCSPTRAAIVTGRYPSSLGIWRNIKRKGDPLRLREPLDTYMHRLAARGYRCHHLGKWHLGQRDDLSCFAEPRQDVEAPHALLAKRRRAAGQEKFADGPRDGEVQVGDVFLTEHTAAKHEVWKDVERRSKQDLSLIGRSRLRPEYHYESVLADYCIELLRRRRNEPFAITWSVSPPHAWWVAPAPFYDQYDPANIELPANWDARPKRWQRTQGARLGELFGPEGVREYIRCYYAQVSMMDWCVGRILDELERLGLAERTAVVFTSDHGDMQGGHGMMDKTTGNFYEEIVRVPLLMRFPGALPSGRTSDVLASSVDLAPTLLELLGAEPLPNAHGRSLRPFAQDAPADDRPVFAERGRFQHGSCGRMIRTRQWKLSLHGSGHRECYWLTRDPGETHNLAHNPKFADQRASLRSQLHAHMKRIGDPALPTLFPDA
jgi:arylsulfatase A-like enzyme